VSPESNQFPFLAVDRFLVAEPGAVAIKTALDAGVIDALLAGERPACDLPIGDVSGRSLLLHLLEASGVVHIANESVRITDDFRAVMRFRDLLMAKIDFGSAVADDVRRYMPQLVGDLPAFMAESTTFALFRYDRCFDPTPENVVATQRWMRFTTALTRYEASAFDPPFDMGAVGRMMDIGGNSGEFALQLCRRHRTLRAVVFDLPVVAKIGRQHVATQPEAGRIEFRSGDVRRDILPGEFDLVTFKSMLHDWPDADAERMIVRAAGALRRGGRIAIFERGPYKVPKDGVPFSDLANLVFYRFFRSPDLYVSVLERLGFKDIAVKTVALDMDFHLVTAERP